jgi:hypothetical protein
MSKHAMPRMDRRFRSLPGQHMSDLERPGRYLTWPESSDAGARLRSRPGGKWTQPRPRAGLRKALITAGIVGVMLAALIMNLAA